MLARLMWNPDYDVEKGIREFAQAVYGDAGYEMTLYARMVSEEETYAGAYDFPKPMLRYGGLHLGSGSTMIFKHDKLRELDELFDRAESKVVKNADVFGRVKIQRLCLDYHILNQLEDTDPLWQKARRDFIVWIRRANVWDSGLGQFRYVPEEGHKDVFTNVDDFIDKYVGGLGSPGRRASAEEEKK